MLRSMSATMIITVPSLRTMSHSLLGAVLPTPPPPSRVRRTRGGSIAPITRAGAARGCGPPGPPGCRPGGSGAPRRAPRPPHPACGERGAEASPRSRGRGQLAAVLLEDLEDVAGAVRVLGVDLVVLRDDDVEGGQLARGERADLLAGVDLQQVDGARARVEVRPHGRVVADVRRSEDQRRLRVGHDLAER